jgi:hypothetical protein
MTSAHSRFSAAPAVPGSWDHGGPVVTEITYSRRVYLDIGWQASAQSAGGIVVLQIVDFRAGLGYTFVTGHFLSNAKASKRE